MSFYYSIPEEIQPLEGAAKMHYASIFPPELSLFLLERKSVTLQCMFADSLEVEENLRMSKTFIDPSCNDRIGKELDLVELHEMKETLSWQPIPLFDKQIEDRHIDEKVCRPTRLFFEDCDHPVASYVHDDFKKLFHPTYIR